ncbi:hypothetical protein BJ912DRAFT_1044182 [Pholiota molesta]|nr:hypothetical protein BJ912DRAFT_1044182 [Pholiota molesta]
MKSWQAEPSVQRDKRRRKGQAGRQTQPSRRWRSASSWRRRVLKSLSTGTSEQSQESAVSLSARQEWPDAKIRARGRVGCTPNRTHTAPLRPSSTLFDSKTAVVSNHHYNEDPPRLHEQHRPNAPKRSPRHAPCQRAHSEIIWDALSGHPKNVSRVTVSQVLIGLLQCAASPRPDVNRKGNTKYSAQNPNARDFNAHPTHPRIRRASAPIWTPESRAPRPAHTPPAQPKDPQPSIMRPAASVQSRGSVGELHSRVRREVVRGQQVRERIREWRTAYESRLAMLTEENHCTRPIERMHPSKTLRRRTPGITGWPSALRPQHSLPLDDAINLPRPPTMRPPTSARARKRNTHEILSACEESVGWPFVLQGEYGRNAEAGKGTSGEWVREDELEDASRTVPYAPHMQISNPFHKPTLLAS